MINIIRKYGIYILLTLSISLNLLQRSCSNSNIKPKPIIIKVKTSEIKDSIKGSKIKRINTTKNNIRYLDREVLVENPITQKLLDGYIKENDSLKRLKMYGEAITIHKQVNTFEDKNLKVDIESEIQGKLLGLSLTNYTIKSQELPIELPPNKEAKFALYAGGGIYYNNKVQEVGYKAGLGFQNKKGDIIDVSYDPLNKAIFLDYKFRLINYKK